MDRWNFPFPLPCSDEAFPFAVGQLSLPWTEPFPCRRPAKSFPCPCPKKFPFAVTCRVTAGPITSTQQHTCRAVTGGICRWTAGTFLCPCHLPRVPFAVGQLSLPWTEPFPCRRPVKSFPCPCPKKFPFAVTCRVTAGPDASEETAYLAAGLRRNFPLP